jgi:hypothetical protein
MAGRPRRRTGALTGGIDEKGNSVTEKDIHKEGVSGSTETHTKTETDPDGGTTTTRSKTTTKPE